MYSSPPPKKKDLSKLIVHMFLWNLVIYFKESNKGFGPSRITAFVGLGEHKSIMIEVYGFSRIWDSIESMGSWVWQDPRSSRIFEFVGLDWTCTIRFMLLWVLYLFIYLSNESICSTWSWKNGLEGKKANSKEEQSFEDSIW